MEKIPADKLAVQLTAKLIETSPELIITNSGMQPEKKAQELAMFINELSTQFQKGLALSSSKYLPD